MAALRLQSCGGMAAHAFAGIISGLSRYRTSDRPTTHGRLGLSDYRQLCGCQRTATILKQIKDPLSWSAPVSLRL
eukprot:scaffold161651_cov44-Prasinocladus_malaysianus.AAC.3